MPCIQKVTVLRFHDNGHIQVGDRITRKKTNFVIVVKTSYIRSDLD